MPCFTAPIDDNGQLLVNVLVTAHTMEYEEMEAAVRGQADGSGIRYCRGLLDTGANKSSITEDLAKSLNLDIVRVVKVHTASETTYANLYRANIHVPFGGEVETNGKISEKLIGIIPWLDVRIIGLPVSSTFDVLLGIDFISQGALHVSGRQFTFCI